MCFCQSVCCRGAGSGLPSAAARGTLMRMAISALPHMAFANRHGPRSGEAGADGGEPGPPRADRASGHARQQRSSARGPGSARGGGHRCADHLRRVQPPGNHEVRQDRVPGPAARAADTVHYQLVHHPGLADLPPVAAVEPHRHLARRASRPRRLDRPADRRVPRESHRARPRCCHSRCLPPPRCPRQQPIDKERRRKRAVYHQLIEPLTAGRAFTSRPCPRRSRTVAIRSALEPGRWGSPSRCHRPGSDCWDPAAIVRLRSRGSAVKSRRGATNASQFGVDLARQGIQGRVGTPDPLAAQGPP